MAEYHQPGEEAAFPVTTGRAPGRPLRELFRRVFVAPFAWREVRNQGVWLYEENGVTHHRRAIRISRCGQPIDFVWLAAGEADGFVVDRDGTTRVPRGSIKSLGSHQHRSRQSKPHRPVAGIQKKEVNVTEVIHPALAEFSAEQLGEDHILRYFHYAHLPTTLQAASKPFCDLARMIVEMLPRNPERTVALRKLLEAKDAAVRANVPAGATSAQPVEQAKEKAIERAVQDSIDRGALRGVATSTNAILGQDLSAFNAVSRRDYFAGQALAGRLANPENKTVGSRAELAELCGSIANAMLADSAKAEKAREDAAPSIAPETKGTVANMWGPFEAFASTIDPGRWYVGNASVAYFATEIGASGQRQANLVAGLLNDCLSAMREDDEGSADDASQPLGTYWRVAEALSRSPALEALVPSNDEWIACESVQDTYDLMKRKLRLAVGTALNAGL